MAGRCTARLRRKCTDVRRFRERNDVRSFVYTLFVTKVRYTRFSNLFSNEERIFFLLFILAEQPWDIVDGVDDFDLWMEVKRREEGRERMK